MQLDKIVEDSGFILKFYEKETGKGYWNYSFLEVFRGSDKIVELERNYPSFPYAIYTNQETGVSYLLCSQKYTGSSCVNLDTGEIANQDSDAFGWCRASYHVHPNQPYVAITGCIWGGEYTVRIFDISDPMTLPWKCVWSSVDPLEGEVYWSDNVLKCEVIRTYYPRFSKYDEDLTEEEDDIVDDLGLEGVARIEIKTFEFKP